MKKNIHQFRDSYSYSLNDNFLYELVLHIDVLSFSCRKQLDPPESMDTGSIRDKLFNCLTAHKARKLSDKIIGAGHIYDSTHYSRVRRYRCDGGIIEVLYGRISDIGPGNPVIKYLPPMMIKIHDADKKILDLVLTIARECRIKLIMSEVEVAFDFYGDDNARLRDFIERHLYLKYQTTRSFSTWNTFYTNNIRQSTGRGIRVYLKDGGGGKRFLRLELVLKRNMIRNLRLKNDLRGIDRIHWSRFFDFRELNERKLKKCILRLNRDIITEFSKGRRPGIAKREIEDIVSFFVTAERSLMAKMDGIKRSIGLKQHHRFLAPLAEFNKLFFDGVSGWKFE